MYKNTRSSIYCFILTQTYIYIYITSQVVIYYGARWRSSAYQIIFFVFSSPLGLYSALLCYYVGILDISIISVLYCPYLYGPIPILYNNILCIIWCATTRRGRCLRRAYYLLYSFGSKTNKRLHERAGGTLHAHRIKRLDGGGDVAILDWGCVWGEGNRASEPEMG